MASRRLASPNSNLHSPLPFHSMDRTKDHEEQTTFQVDLALSAL